MNVARCEPNMVYGSVTDCIVKGIDEDILTTFI